MIDDAIYTKFTGFSIILNDNNIPFRRFLIDTEIRNDTEYEADDHGAYPTPTLMGTSRFEVEGDLFGLDSADYLQRRKALVQAVMPSWPIQNGHIGTLDLQLTGYPERVLADVTLATSPVLPAEAGSPSRATYQIQWKSFDPRLYGSTLNQAQNFSGNKNITNAGNAPSPPVVVLNGNGVVTLDGTYSLHVEGAPSGATILDFSKKTARSTGGLDRYNYVRGTWFQIPEGAHVINILGTTGTVRYRNAYVLIV